MNSKNRFLLVNLLSVEFVLLNLVLILFLFLRLPDFSFSNIVFLKKLIPLVIIYNLSWLFIILYIRDKEFYFDPDYDYFKSLMTSLFFFVGFVMTLLILLRMNYFNRSTFLIPIFIFTFLNFVTHKYLLKYLKKRRAKNLTNTLLIGSSHEFSKLIRFKKGLVKYGYVLNGFLENKEGKSRNVLNLKINGGIDDLPTVLANNSIDEVFISVSELGQGKIKELIKIADNFGVRVKLIPEYPQLLAGNFNAGTIGDIAVYKLRQSPLDNFNTTIIKSLFDFCFALMVIVVLSPIYLLIAILIYLDSGGPIIYTPHRKGEAGKTFKCYKFRTMSVCDNPLNGKNRRL